MWLRISAPHLVRPFRVGLPWWGCALMLAPASLLLLALIAMPVLRMDLQARPEPYACSAHCLTIIQRPAAESALCHSALMLSRMA